MAPYAQLCSVEVELLEMVAWTGEPITLAWSVTLLNSLSGATVHYRSWHLETYRILAISLCSSVLYFHLIFHGGAKVKLKLAPPWQELVCCFARFALMTFKSNAITVLCGFTSLSPRIFSWLDFWSEFFFSGNLVGRIFFSFLNALQDNFFLSSFLC